MTAQDVSLLLGVLGGTCVMTSWIGRWTGDAARDVRLMFGMGAALLLAGAALRALW